MFLSLGLPRYPAGVRRHLLVLVAIVMLPVILAARDDMYGQLGVTLACLVVGVLLAWLAAREVTQPILRLREEVGTLARTGYARRVPVEGPAEIRALAADFNAMAALIQDSQTRLKVSERRFRELAELSSDWYWETDAEHRFTFVSSGAERFFGGAVSESIGRRRWEIDYLNMSDEAWRLHRAQLDRGKAFDDFRLSRRLPSGMVVHFAISGRPMYDDDGNVRGYRGVGHDLTAQIEAQNALHSEHGRLMRVFETLAEGIVLFDADGRYLHMNDVAERILGASRRQLRGRRLDEFPVRREPVSANDEHFQVCVFQRLRDGELREANGTFYVVRPDRSRVLVSRNAARLEDSAGRFDGIVATFEDVTERARSEERNRLFLANTHDGFWVVDRSGRIHEVNRAMCRLLGRSEDELLGRRVCDVVSGISEAAMAERIARAVREGHVRHETQHVVPGATPVMLEVTATYVDADGGRVYAFFQDVSERRELESYNHSIAHDLRQPLNGIIGFADLIRERPADSRGWADEIAANAVRMEQLLGSLLGLAGRGELHREPVDMRALAAGELRAAPAGVETVLGELPAVRGDPVLLRQVWANLVGNAIKYSAKGAAPRVEIMATRQDGTVEYTVRDNGVGFDMRHAERLFGPFQRLPGSEGFEGSGIGLTIVERIVRRHGGAIRAESVPGMGATFRFTLPDSPLT